MMKNNLSRLGSRQKQMYSYGLSAVAALFIAGCASTSAPTEQMVVSRTAVSNASAAGANEFAPIQYKSAMDKMAGAEQAMGAKDYELAQQLAEQAEVDAKLGAAMARSAKAQKAADALQENIRVLRQEIDRQAK